mgnify:CR=1 FL=1
MENSELKLINRLAGFKNIDSKEKVAKAGKLGKHDMKKSKSIKVYEPMPTQEDDLRPKQNLHDYSDLENNAYNIPIPQQLFQNDSTENRNQIIGDDRQDS